MVVVLPGPFAWVNVGRWDELGDAVFDVNIPLFFVDQMVVGAEEDAVVGAGGSALTSR